MTLQDLDHFHKSANKAVAGGQNYDTWLNQTGKRLFHSWSQRAASSGATPIQPQPGAPAITAGVSTTARGGHVPTGGWSAGVVGNGRATSHQVAHAGGNPVASGSWDPHSVLNRPLSDQLAQLTVLMQSTRLRDAMDNNVFLKN